jgi:ribosomal protein S18 acetylase RimI-like enzyme
MLTLEPLSERLVTSLKTARLRALQDTPAAFGRTYAEESQLSDADWLKRVTTWNSGSSSVCYIAMEEGAPCGIIAGYLDDHDPPRPNVASMWVAPAYRRTGLGTRLLNEVQQWAESLGVPQLRLMVTSGNESAMHFYERFGFVFTGTTGPYRNDPAFFEYEMVKSLRSI